MRAVLPEKRELGLIIFIIAAIMLTAYSRAKIEKTDTVYPPVFSKKYPLSTPISFAASMLGMRRLAADIVWLKTLQYYGQKEGTAAEFGRTSKGESLGYYPELKSYWIQLIRFDPFFINAYLIAPTTLGWNLKRYDEAMSVLDEGIQTIEKVQKDLGVTQVKETDGENPLLGRRSKYFEDVKWELYTLKSVIILLHQEKFTEAIPLLEKIAFRKDTPDEIKVILAQVYHNQKAYSKEYRLWRDIYENSYDMKRRESAVRHMSDLRGIIFSN